MQPPDLRVISLKIKNMFLHQLWLGPSQWICAYLPKITLTHFLSMPIFGVSCMNFNKFHYHTFITHQIFMIFIIFVANSYNVY